MIRVRFAPSPTGYLHVGGARTALYNWLFARKTGGVLVLRIEDTDRDRSSEEHIRAIVDGMTWLGISWDEGPTFQGAHGDQHRADAMQLLEAGRAYRCFCTPAQLEADRAAAAAEGGDAFRYNGRCRTLPIDHAAEMAQAGSPFTVRLIMPQEELAWDDAVHGRITFQGADLDDFVILRTDGSPIYNLAVVSDDIAMDITHVIRGDDHISNTPKQLAIYRGLGRTPPIFAHVPMIHGTDGRKLSKRHGATAVGDYRDRGILPEALRNFLLLLGWSSGDDTELFTEEEMIARFSLEGIQRKAAVFDPTKLEWMNGQYLTSRSAADLEPITRRELARLGVDPGPRDLIPLISAVQGRARTTLQLAERVALRLDPGRAIPDEKVEALRRKLGPAWTGHVQSALHTLESIPATEWEAPLLLERLTALAAETGVKLGDIMQPIRAILTGTTVSEPVNELLVVIGREASLHHLRTSLAS